MKFIFYYIASIVLFLYTTLITGAPAVTNTKVVIIKTTSVQGKGSMKGPSPKRGRSPSPRRGRGRSPSLRRRASPNFRG